MARGWIHTVYREGFWINEVEDGGQISRRETKERAVEVGREAAQARGTEHVIHDRDGTIAARNSYGNDPFPPRG
jgi:hypothetical protein